MPAQCGHSHFRVRNHAGPSPPPETASYSSYVRLISTTYVVCFYYICGAHPYNFRLLFARLNTQRSTAVPSEGLSGSLDGHPWRSGG